ncbi:MAG TPA: aminopeptidase P family protein [Nitrospirae bacterium]|nr:aminopeptidase P family protein [Nitrospirota bacterium]
MQNFNEKIQDTLRAKKINAFLITDINNIYYLTGFTGSSGFCLITAKSKHFFTDFRYVEQAEQEVSGWTLNIEKGKRIDVLRKFIKKNAINNLAFETSISFLFYTALKALKIPLKALNGLVENLRKHKNDMEIDLIKLAYKRAENAFLDIKRFIKKGAKESHIALRLENALKNQGCKKIPFDIIVASGVNSSKPHATVSDKVLQGGDLITIDWGGENKGYYSDMTRTFLIQGKDIERKSEIYNIVNKARDKAINAIKIGVKAKNIDSVARKYITDKGYGDYFGHGLGHGIGLLAHEEPRINKISTEILTNGMVFTIEPGIYIREFGGVRIEDTVVINNDKIEILNNLPTKLEIL